MWRCQWAGMAKIQNLNSRVAFCSKQSINWLRNRMHGLPVPALQARSLVALTATCGRIASFRLLSLKGKEAGRKGMESAVWGVS